RCRFAARRSAPTFRAGCAAATGRSAARSTCTACASTRRARRSPRSSTRRCGANGAACGSSTARDSVRSVASRCLRRRSRAGWRNDGKCSPSARHGPTTAARARRSCCCNERRREMTVPSTYVLLHGAWHGGWCWKRVAEPLRAEGHAVYTPTQTGLGERSHLLSRELTLDVFVQDVVHVL